MVVDWHCAHITIAYVFLSLMYTVKKKSDESFLCESLIFTDCLVRKRKDT